jgi:mRNA interferase MazF
LVIERGRVCWAEPQGAGPVARFPVIVVQAEPFNRSRIPTVLAVPLTANLRLAQAPGNVRVPGHLSGLQRDAVANVAHVVTLERRHLRPTTAQIAGELIAAIDEGLRLALGL